jgi:hypothetical protein
MAYHLAEYADDLLGNATLFHQIAGKYERRDRQQRKFI